MSVVGDNTLYTRLVGGRLQSVRAGAHRWRPLVPDLLTSRSAICTPSGYSDNNEWRLTSGSIGTLQALLVTKQLQDDADASIDGSAARNSK